MSFADCVYRCESLCACCQNIVSSCHINFAYSRLCVFVCLSYDSGNEHLLLNNFNDFISRTASNLMRTFWGYEIDFLFLRPAASSVVELGLGYFRLCYCTAFTKNKCAFSFCWKLKDNRDIEKSKCILAYH